MALMSFFPETYDEAIRRTRTWLASVQEIRPQAREQRALLYPEENLDFTWIEGTSPKASRALLLTAGLHGIEGYAGIALLDLFVNEYLSRVEPSTDVYIVPVINPWGLKHERRVNPNNVDLNRNFLDAADFSQDLNPEYARLASFLHPERPVSPRDRYLFYLQTLWCIRKCGQETLRRVYPQGQNRFPRGLHYAGQERQPETQYLLDLVHTIAREHESIIHLDMHTGFGPKNTLTLVFPASESRSVETLRDMLKFPHITKVAAADFYPIQGDLSEYLHQTLPARTSTQVLTFALEYGTIGHRLASLRAIVLENRLYWHGATSPRVARWVRHEFRELFYPHAPTWRAQVIAQARKVFQSIVEGRG